MTRIRTIVVAVLLAASTYGVVRGSAPAQTGTWGSAGAIADSRMGAAAVPLGDGRTLIAGGTVAGGTATDTVVIFDPIAKSFTAAGQLIAARVGHTATLLADGRVLVIGGTIGNQISADVELFDPASGASTLVALMGQPRTAHAAARLADGTVLIVGGSTTDRAVLQSAEIFNPASSTVTLLSSSLQRRRAGATATTLIDGRVLVVGGNDGNADLGSAEEYYPASQAFALVPTQLSVRRSGHTAVLLPHNNGVLVAGGTAVEQAVSAADLYLPAIFPDPFSLGVGEFVATGSMVTSRTGAVGGPAGEGYAFAAGGGPGDVETYRFATIKTDKDDYAPGERAVITGSGWQPGEEVTLLFQEDPAVHEDYTFTVTAGATGNIFWDQWAPEEHDLNVRFYLTARDSRSRAQTTFTDGRQIVVSVSAPGSSANITRRFFSTNDTCTGTVAPTTFTLADGATQTVASQMGGQQSIQLTAAAAAANGVPFSGWSVVVSGGNAIPLDLTQPTICVPGSGGVNNNNQGVYTYTANYAQPEVSVTVSPSSVAEDAVQNLIYTFQRTGSTSSTLTVDFSVGGTATFSTDYTQSGAASFTALTGTVTFANGSATASITIDPTTDPSIEPDETVILTVVSGTGYTVGSPSSATGTITNDDQNAPPTVARDNATVTVNEGQTATNTGTWSDVNAGDTVTLSASVGTITKLGTNAAGTWNWSFTTTDGPNDSQTVTITANDGNGGVTSTTFALTVNNVAPTIALNGAASVSEGSAYTLTLGSVVDPGSDTVTSYVIHWGDGTNESFSGSPNAVVKTHTYADGPNNYTITVDLVDEDGTHTGAGSKAITVNNVPPTITLTGAANVNEGSSYSLTLGTVVDPGTDTVASYVIHWGDGGTDTFFGSPNGLVKTHTYADGPNNYTITVDLVDEDGTHLAAGTKAVTVDNVPPTVTAGADATVDEGSVFAQAGSFTDPGADTWTATVDYGDGSGTQPLSLNPDKTFSLSHTYADNGVFTVTVTVNDEDGGNGTDTVTVTVNNVPPTVSAGADATIDEGSAFTRTGSFTDPGTADTWMATVNYGDGSATQPLTLNPDKTFSLSHTYADNGVFTVTVTVTDDDGGSGTDSVQVTVNNVPPTVSAGADATIDEGSAFTRTGSFTDPGTDTWTATVDYGDGSGTQPLSLNPDKTFGLNHLYADNGTFTVTVKVTDDDGGIGTDTVIVTVKNVAPTVSAGADATINEGSAFTRTGSFTDPGTADTWTATVDYGDGSGTQALVLNADKTFSLSHTYADNGVFTVTVTVTDDDGGIGTDAATVTVNNVPPTIALTGAASVFEGSSYTLTLGTVVDPGTDTVTSYTIRWGDGTNQTFMGSPNGLSKTHTYLDGPNNYTIAVDLVDEDGTHAGAGTKAVAVFNVPPTIALSGAASVNEGSSYSLTLGTVVDPGIDIVTSYVIHWGDGTDETFSGSPNTVTRTHTYVEGPNNYTITVDLVDEDGTHAAAGGKAITVNNVAPVITSITGPAVPIAINTPTTITANFTDAGTLDTHTCTFDWDETPNQTSPGIVTESNGSGSCSASHTYAAPGVYGVLVTVTDDDTGSAQSTFEFVVVFDPNGGFVTGGGWIMSPAGAYASDLSLTGKANFGFVSKYKKGSSIPEGQTEFQFQAGALNFHSSAYEYGSLVVSNFKAQYKGTGTINGVAGYKFILTAHDGQIQGGGGIDKFRIKIIRISTDEVVYDNGLGASDDIDITPMAIGGGSIVIHDNGKK